MRALVVYESMFGNTRITAEAIAVGLSTEGVDVEASEVSATSAQLDDLAPNGSAAVAAFDSHVDKKVPGSASRSATRRLRRRGYRAIVPPVSFYVSGMQGPLATGEIDRARVWGAKLGAALRSQRTASATG